MLKYLKSCDILLPAVSNLLFAHELEKVPARSVGLFRRRCWSLIALNQTSFGHDLFHVQRYSFQLTIGERLWVSALKETTFSHGLAQVCR